MEVGKEYLLAWGWYPLMGVLGGGVMTAVAYWEPAPAVAFNFSLATGACASILVGLFAHYWWNRRFLEPTESGVIVTDRSGRLELSDSDITDLGIAIEMTYSRGAPSQYRRYGQFTAETPAGSRVISYNYYFPRGGADWLAPWFKRLQNRLVDVAQTKLANGQELAGDGWALSHTALTVSGEDYPVDDLTSVQLMDGKLCVWAADAEPVLQIPASGTNAAILHNILDERLAGRVSSPRSGDLGRLLFERGANGNPPNDKRNYSQVIGVGIGVTVVLLLILAAAFGHPQKSFLPVFIGLIVSMAAAIGIWILVSPPPLTDRYQFYELGVRARVNGNTRTLLWTDCVSYAHAVTRQFLNGVFVGNEVSLVFVPANSSEPIIYATPQDGGDEALDQLRGLLAPVIAGRMLKKLAAGENVAWLPGAEFTPGGLLVRPDGALLRLINFAERLRGSTVHTALDLSAAGKLGRKEGVVIPYSDIRCTIEDGTFAIHIPEETKPLIKESTAAPNFYPGLHLLDALMNLEEPAR